MAQVKLLRSPAGVGVLAERVQDAAFFVVVVVVDGGPAQAVAVRTTSATAADAVATRLRVLHALAKSIT
jgi:aminoglycoside phosphotransferase